MASSESPYLSASDRLADVIAAIQVMGTFKYYQLSFARWAARISGDSSQADHWRMVFEQHPEFFRLDSKRKKAALAWRRQRQKLFDVDNEAKITKHKYNTLTKAQRKRISRMPLESDELATLINTAINLHSRSLEHKRDTRWWISGAIGLIGVVVGALIKAASE